MGWWCLTMRTLELLIVGGGPAGLSAAKQAAELGVRTTLLDANDKPGGQLFKQIHKFFGSKEHGAGTRGTTLAHDLVHDVLSHEIDVQLKTTAWGIFPDHRVVWESEGKMGTLSCERLLLATGAQENAISFPGWHLPGVMGAGAAQTLINCHHVLPGNRALVVGSGNVGLIVAYQLLQAGIDVAAVVEAQPHISGYGVHASKIRRMGVPIYTSHTILASLGKEQVEQAIIASVDHQWQAIDGTEKQIDVDLICLAVGLSPLAKLANTAGCRMVHNASLGGYMPYHDASMRTSQDWIYAAGDLAGIEEASAAIEEGRIAAISIAQSLGKIDSETGDRLREGPEKRLMQMRDGPYGWSIAEAKASLFGHRKVDSGRES